MFLIRITAVCQDQQHMDFTDFILPLEIKEEVLGVSAGSFVDYFILHVVICRIK